MNDDHVLAIRGNHETDLPESPPRAWRTGRRNRDAVPRRYSILSILLICIFGCSQNLLTGGEGTSIEVVGRVVTPDSTAAKGLAVTLLRYMGNDRGYADTITAITDHVGKFTFRNPDTGRYLLVIRDDEGRSAMEEVVLGDRDLPLELGTLVVNASGYLRGYINIDTDATVDANTIFWVYKGKLPVCAIWVRYAYLIDSLPPGGFNIRMYGQIVQHDEYYLGSQSIKIIDSTVTIQPSDTVVIDTLDINEAMAAAVDTTAAGEIKALKAFLSEAGCPPVIPAGWFHPNTGRIRVIEAGTTTRMSLDSAARSLAAFPGIEKIRLSGFTGASIPETLFTLQELTELSLTDGEITAVPDRIVDLVKLRTLQLGGNAITRLPESVLDRSIPSLQSADFTGNPLRRIDWEQQRSINTLFADGITIILTGKAFAINERDYRALLSFFESNGLDDRIVHSSIATGIDDEPDVVTRLSLDDAIITGFPDDFGDLKGLRELYIARNGIDSMPDVLGKLKALRHLHLTNGTLRFLSLQLGGCTSLETLDFSNNRIEHLPKWLGSLRSLEYADFSFNCVDTTNTTVPMKCIVGQRQCDSVPAAPDSLFAADTATVRAMIDHGITGDSPPLMTHIQCRGNRVVLLRLVIDNEIRMDAFDTLCGMAASLDSLRTLHIVMRHGGGSFPELSTVFRHLEDLIITGGTLSALPESFETVFPSLKRISLPGNRFRSIPQVLPAMSSLAAVDLHFNYLSSLSREDSLWLDGVAAADPRVLWDSGFSHSYEQGMTWQDSQLEETPPEAAPTAPSERREVFK